MIALNRSSTCSCTDSQTNKCLFLLLLWQGWVFLGLKNWSVIFWMARSQYFGNILRELPQTSTTTCKWPSTFHITLQRSSTKCDCEFSLWNSEKWSVVTRDRFIFFFFFFCRCNQAWWGMGYSKELHRDHTGLLWAEQSHPKLSHILQSQSPARRRG